MNKRKKLKAISLFCSGGIGDLPFQKLGIDILLANEIIPSRCSIYQNNYQKTKMICGDIHMKKNEIIKETKKILNGENLDFVIATPPCQGMSKNGQGKLLNAIRKGLKPKYDKRNELIIPTVEIIKKLNPDTIFLENVPEMEKTLIPTKKYGVIKILDYINKEISNKYFGCYKVLNFCDYGIPQKRKRLITIFSKNEKLVNHFERYNSYFPEPSHSQFGRNGKKKWVTVKNIIKNFPSLDAKNKELSTSKIPYHYVSVLDKKKYFWISNTPEQKSSFDNQCIHCGFDKNPTHKSIKDEKGINKASTKTPIKCMKCDELLPRPWVEKNGSFRLMRGFTSAYKRMNWDEPCPTLTRNLSYVSSDNKIHPSQNRALSFYEAFHLHTINEYEYKWQLKNGLNANDKLIRDVIGESIPPKGIEVILNHLIEIEFSLKKSLKSIKNKTYSLFDLL